MRDVSQQSHLNPLSGQYGALLEVSDAIAAHRDRVNAKVMKDPRIKDMCDPKNMPFDVKRMAYGGFKVLVDG